MRGIGVPVAFVLAVGLAAAGCGGGGNSGSTGGTADQSAPVSRAQVPDSVRAQLDSGNAAYRAKDYEAARQHYRAAVGMAPDFTAAWFGVYMAETALGNQAAADSAKTHLGSMEQAAGAHNMPHGEMMPHGAMPTDTGGATPHRDSV
jgi:hypothetical protein